MIVCSNCGSVISPFDNWASSTVPICDSCLGGATSAPVPMPIVSGWVPNQAISLRDFFAGMALAGMIPAGAGKIATNEKLTRIVFEIADAMLKAREGGEGR